MSDPNGRTPADYRPRNVLVVGRAIHAPWNEGTRVIASNTARAASRLADVDIVSVTHEEFRSFAASSPGVHHVFSRQAYGTRGDYVVLPQVLRRVARVMRDRNPTVTHLIGTPLAMAPLLRSRGSAVVAHVTLTKQAYLPRIDVLRARLGWHFFDRWIDAYACSSPVIRDELAVRGQSRAKLHVVPPPVDTDLFAPGDRAEARRRLGWDEYAFIVAYVGTVSPLRFPAATVLSALSLAAPTIPGISLEVFAPLATHQYNVAWASGHLAAEASLSTVRVTTTVRDLSEDEKVLVYHAADALLLPFAAPVAVEPPLTLLEGMACGAIPFVAPYANRSSIVSHGVNGFEWDGAGSLAGSLVELRRRSTAEVDAISRAARDVAVNGYGFAVAAAALSELWASIGRPSERGRKGLTVAIVGPDGAGKSSLVAALHERSEFRTVPIYMGVDRTKATHSLPTTRWLVRRAMRTWAPRDVPAGPRRSSRTRTTVRNVIALPHELLEFGYRYLVGWRASRAGSIVLFDRYLYDSLVDSRVDGGGGWSRLRGRVFAALFPPPELMIVLDAPGATLYERKAEHDPDRLDRVGAETRRLASRARRTRVIDATLPIDEVTAIAAAAIREAMDGSTGTGDRSTPQR